MNLRDLGLIGNCQIAALVDSSGAIVWSCLPRFDSEPVFGALLDPDGGQFLIGAADGTRGVQRYLENTNVLETLFFAKTGGDSFSFPALGPEKTTGPTVSRQAREYDTRLSRPSRRFPSPPARSSRCCT